jgi:hypothetical protein
MQDRSRVGLGLAESDHVSRRIPERAVARLGLVGGRSDQQLAGWVSQNQTVVPVSSRR